jgi:lipopolysaccharide export system permease protein
MAIIRQLITREWLRFFVSSLVVLLLLLTVGNLVSGFLRGNVSHKEVLLSYLIQLPTFITQVTPVSCLIASLFSINKLKNRNELTAIFAGGYSRQSFFYDLLQVSIYVALFQFLMSAYVTPLFKAQRHNLLEGSIGKFRSLNKQGLSASTIGSGKIWYKSNGYYFAFSHFDTKTDQLINVSVYNYDQYYKLKSVAQIKSLTYSHDSKEWIPQGHVKYTNLNEPSFPNIVKISEPLKLKEEISDFKQIEADITTLSFMRLLNYISQLNESGINVGEYLVVFYKHISDSLICIVFALLAAIPVFNPNRRNSSFGKSATFVFIFTILYWLVQSYFIELGKNLKISAVVACFSMPFLFSVFIASVFYKNRKLA